MDKKQNLLIINRYFYPDITSVPQLLTELSEDLVKKGVNVSVLCSRNSYNSKKKYEKYENYKNIDIYRVNNISGKNRGILKRILELINFSFAVFFKSVFLKNIDIIMVLSSPPMIALVGVLISKIKCAKLIYVIEDLHPEIEIELGIIKPDSIYAKILKKINLFVIKRADTIITLCKRMKNKVIKYGEKFSDKIKIIPNWSDGKIIYPIPKSENPFVKKISIENKFIIQYSGNMGLGHTFETILEGVKRLKNEKEILFQFIGGGAKRKEIDDFIKKEKLDNVMLLPYQPYKELNLSLNMADISLISIKKGLGGLLLPSKFYGIIASGTPFILIGDENNEIYDFVKINKLGRFVLEGDIDCFSDSIMLYYKNRNLLKEEGLKLREIFLKNFDREIAVKKYYKIIKGLGEEN